MILTQPLVKAFNKNQDHYFALSSVLNTFCCFCFCCCGMFILPCTILAMIFSIMVCINYSLYLLVSKYVSFSSNPTRSCNHKLVHNYTKYSSSRHFYFNRLPRLWNKLVDCVDIMDCSLLIAKRRILSLMWESFTLNFDSDNICSFHFLCPCSKCINSFPQVKSISISN